MITVLDFYANWCQPCKMYDKYLPEVMAELDIEIRKINVEEEPDLAAFHGVESLPTLIFVDDQQTQVGQIIGAYPARRLCELTTQIVDSIRKVETINPHLAVAASLQKGEFVQ